jgi:hypothetical protein
VGTNNLPAASVQIPIGGAIYQFIATTNLKGWGVKIYEGTDNTGKLFSTHPCVSSPVIKPSALPTNDTVSVIIPANGSYDFERTFSFYLYGIDFPCSDAEIFIATRTQGRLIWAGYADFIYFDENNVLQVGQWGAGEEVNSINMALFKYGSVVGFINGAAWNNSTSIKYNPTTIENYTWAGLPVYATADYNANLRNVSANAYHTLANVKEGKGDPCRLVGMTVNQIQSLTSDAQLYALERGWRLPTLEENVAFCLHPIWATKAVDSGTTEWSGYYFPATAGVKENFLPAAGGRSTSGTVMDQGSVGRYWMSTAASSGSGHNLDFSAGHMLSSHSNSKDYGFSIRCVNPE